MGITKEQMRYRNKVERLYNLQNLEFKKRADGSDSYAKRVVDYIVSLEPGTKFNWFQLTKATQMSAANIYVAWRNPEIKAAFKLMELKPKGSGWKKPLPYEEQQKRRRNKRRRYLYSLSRRMW